MQPSRQPRDYSHLYATLESIAMTQHSMKKGLKVFGDAGIEVVLLKELLQLHDEKVLEPKCCWRTKRKLCNT